ncbi:MAG: hypothetical protein EOM59_13425 [Clostridia bacterium]|jgi:hypothetical protein|nr:hypothetical protein [Salinivirgaceae bacterium]NCB43601.1 hypothetical protein [Clostridia bacterium]
MTYSVFSVHNIPVRLTNERWRHISVGHPEMADYIDQILDCVENPEIVYKGSVEEFLAVKSLDNEKSKFIVVVYKETDDNDGFIITSFITNKLGYLNNEQVLWKQQK